MCCRKADYFGSRFKKLGWVALTGARMMLQEARLAMLSNRTPSCIAAVALLAVCLPPRANAQSVSLSQERAYVRKTTELGVTLSGFVPGAEYQIEPGTCDPHFIGVPYKSDTASGTIDWAGNARATIWFIVRSTVSTTRTCVIKAITKNPVANVGAQLWVGPSPTVTFDPPRIPIGEAAEVRINVWDFIPGQSFSITSACATPAGVPHDGSRVTIATGAAGQNGHATLTRGIVVHPLSPGQDRVCYMLAQSNSGPSSVNGSSLVGFYGSGSSPDDGSKDGSGSGGSSGGGSSGGGSSGGGSSNGSGDGAGSEPDDSQNAALPGSEVPGPEAAPPASLDFPHFAGGGGWKSELVLVNPGGATVHPEIRFRSSDGLPLPPKDAVDITDDLEVDDDGILTVRDGIPPFEVLSIATHGSGDPVTGSVQVEPGGAVGGILRIGHPDWGHGAVGPVPTFTSAVLPVRHLEGVEGTEVSTHIAIRNRESSPILVRCELRRRGALHGFQTIPLAAGAQAQWSLDSALAPSTRDFAGTMRCDAVVSGTFSITAWETDSSRGSFVVLPAVPEH